MFDINDLKSIKISLASPEKIRAWSHGEVKKFETINYRSQKPEMGGLFCEKIFGPSKDYECHCGKYKKIRYQGVTCEKCGVEVISKEVRRERMGHIELASPVTHIWYLKSVPSRIGLVLDIPAKQLEEIIYFAAHVVINPGSSKFLTKGQHISEKNGPADLLVVIKDFVDKLDKDSYDYTRANELISKLENYPQEPFDFQTTASFISKHTGAEFGEGAEAIKKLLKEIDLDAESAKLRAQIKESKKDKQKKLMKRLAVIEAFRSSGNRPEWMVLDCIPVLPPDLRPMCKLEGGRFAVSDLNELYRRVITRNNRLKRLIEMNAPSVILLNEKRMVQEAVDALIDNGRRNKPVQGPNGRTFKCLTSILKGKQGRFRQNLLGKRVDYSGRSVIAVGPDLKMYECGIPREMAIQLLRPYIVSLLIKRGYASAHKQAEKLIDRYDEKVFDIVEEIISDHPVLLNRAPTLHRLGIQAFQPKLVAGRAIRLHPLVCTGFNADFDGDQMAVHLPLSKSAQEEAVDLMLASNNILGPKDGKPIVTPSQDMVLGNYYLTLESTKEYFEGRAKKCEEMGDNEEAERFHLYAESEGKVFRNIDEVERAYLTKQINLHNRIAIPGKEINKDNLTEEEYNGYLITTVGKLIFNKIYPADFPYLNDPSNKKNFETTIASDFVAKGTNIKEYIAKQPIRKPYCKKDLGTIINQIFRRYGTTKTSVVLDKMKDQGFKYSTYAGITVSIADINVVDEKKTYIEEGDKAVNTVNNMAKKGYYTDAERHKKVVEIWENIRKKFEVALKKHMDTEIDNPIYMMANSGARGNISNFTQLSAMRGLMANPSGETIELPIKSCFREGIKVSEFFIATHGARKGGADTALKTADSGYLTRRLVDVSHDVVVREEDCGTDVGFVVNEIRDTARDQVIVPLKDRLVGRYSLHDIVDPVTGEILVPGNTLMTNADAQRIVDAGITHVEIRSLLGCQTRHGVCKHCYGLNLATGKEVEIGEAVGIMAAQSIGEPGTQLTMRTFHTGGVAGSDITQGLPRVQELFESRNPKGRAVISKIYGKVKDIKENNGCYTITIENEETNDTKVETTTFGARLRVKVGDEVRPGQKITEGAIYPVELLINAGVYEVEKYIIKEVQKVYRAQGIEISDKHIEVIVSQMLRKVHILDGGDTQLLPDTLVDKEAFTDANTEVLLKGGKPAVCVPEILRITKAALETESFLSAASFQETAKILTDAAIKGKTDILHGLKENVITGKLIPAGRGLLSDEQEEKLLEGFEVKSKMDIVKQQYIEKFDQK